MKTGNTIIETGYDFNENGWELMCKWSSIDITIKWEKWWKVTKSDIAIKWEKWWKVMKSGKK